MWRILYDAPVSVLGREEVGQVEDLVVPVLLLLGRGEVDGALLCRRADQKQAVLGVTLTLIVCICCSCRFWIVTLLRITLTAINGGFICDK